MKGLLTASLLVVFAASFAQTRPLAGDQKQEVSDLKAKAAKLTKQVSVITANSNLQESDEAVKLLKDVVEELSAIRDRLKALEDFRDATTKKQGAAQPAQPASNTRFTGYLQFQYFNTDKIGTTAFDAFSVRRARFGIIQKVDPRATLRLSADFADGTDRMQTRLKDAFLEYDMTPTFGTPGRVSFGQMPLPLGWDLEKSDADRETPERSIYSRALFAGERGRGVTVRASLNKNVEGGIGIANALTSEDVEQLGIAPGSGEKLAGYGYVRATGPNYRVGVSGLVGKRPAFTSGLLTSPEVDRRFLYLDGEYRFDKAYVRGEVMMGHDRVPNATADPSRIGHEMSGFQAQAGYNFNDKNQINFRWEQFDPNKDAGGNAVNGYAFSFQHFLSQAAKFQLTHEIFVDESRAGIGQRRFFQTTLRVQFRF